MSEPLLLIDGTNLHAGGGRALFVYLLEKLAGKNFVALASHRLEIPNSNQIEVKPWVSPLSKKRQAFLEQAVKRHTPNRVFCFGNIPPRKHLGCDTTTFFQNAHLLPTLDKHCRYSIKNRIRYAMLRRGVRNFSTNSDSWIVQSNFIKSSLIAEYRIPHDKAHVIPYFDEQDLRSQCKAISRDPDPLAFVYVSDGQPHKNHSRLLDAWELIYAKNQLNPVLHLTIPQESVKLIERIDSLRLQGLKIKNHGRLPRQEAMDLIARCKFSIFPSLLETLGLGLVEGCLLGNQVIAPDNPALEEIITPSITMNPLSKDSIAQVVETALKTELAKPRVLVSDRSDELVSFLTTPSIRS